ncbi:hypothetical protein ACFQ0O_16975 [Saccharopolyspora spinosporotrichia]
MPGGDGGGHGSDEAVRRAAGLRAVLADHRATGDQERRLADEALQALTDAGLFRAWVPRRFGGLEYDLRTIVDSTAALATADPSAAWLVMILSCGDWLTGLFPERAQHDVFGEDPDTRVCQVLTPTPPRGASTAAGSPAGGGGRRRDACTRSGRCSGSGCPSTTAGPRAAPTGWCRCGS